MSLEPELLCSRLSQRDFYSFIHTIMFVCVCVCSCVYSRVRSRCLVCRPSHLCACRVGRRHPSSKLRPSSTAHAHTHKIQSRTSSQHGPKITGVEVRVEPSLATGSASGPGSVVACGPSIHYTEWNSRYDSEGHQEPANTLAGSGGEEGQSEPAELVLLADV
jgi:hypothetical protein